ncbi:hypothetical protein SJZ98_04595 [Acinetobacter baumannii]|uniref:hypothetical protein n=1 Tax=Acinetobacter baumannii TaxID=470 RepID=UPI0022B5440B|nr:hypothetical protein [Acinetobacter baumannii]MDC5157260.1 hypothetical protein [Acinetobacter baumannii]MDX7883193.1 hypothetical protein [Acinetobacter baumannii]
MISLNLTFSDEFIDEYSFFCVNYLKVRMNEIKQKTNHETSSKLDKLFNEEELIKIISAEPSELESISNKIYSEIPVLAERYHQKKFFSKFLFEDDYKKIKLNTNEGRIKIIEIKDKIVLEIQKFQALSPSILLEEVLLNIKDLTKASAIKSELNTIKSIITGTCKADRDFIKKFPEWVEDISNAFNYVYVMRDYGKKIIEIIDLEYCPYCADEEIEAFKSYRPAIDHYFPQSKYPFLALSLYNFIPSGNRCNSNFKKAHLMENHFHPNLDVMPSQRLFEFLFPLDRKITEDDVKVSLKNVCNKLEANNKLFKLDEVYNKNGIKRKFAYLHDKVNWLIQAGMDKNNIISDSEQIHRNLNIDLALSSKKVQHKKFMVDSINFLCDCSLNTD